MKLYYRIRSFVAIQWSKLLPSSYRKFTLSNTKQRDSYTGTTIKKPIKEWRVALITSAGVHLKTDEPFNVETLEGDHTYRIFPSTTKHEDLDVTHIYYDTRHSKADVSIVFPLEQLKSLEGKVIKAVSEYNIGLNGGTLNHKPHEEITAPKVAEILKNDQVDLAILVPG
ncbi:glycine/sarcosine/betaine reductase selenoprotein B family protein [Alkalihalophilus marmarensis]|uniref:glycine/sarcosine/betaine reductase selenoprotein B family protein n=1 Tax=Alkalihalophilus marmarensis TaxID=521377 RepID=UPI002DB94958|nr:glycine/sarcosine/betaine reductase selenoprotein B family protein [Alkalihalophilus marmarensis]MEC2074427.1 glycine/sarcosine/betaine reductase selenoprotein B family protein [Alkalihalophilus marmarensis]